MRKVFTASKETAFIWDFSAGDSGAIGTYSTKINIPVTAVISDMQLNVLTGIVGGAAASFLIDWAGNAAIAGFGNVVPVGAQSFGPIAVAAINTNPLVTLRIFGNTFTAGKYIFNFSYIDSADRG